LDEEEKIGYDIDTIAPWKLHGYTPFGRNTGLAGGDKKHGVEAYTVSEEGFFTSKHRPSEPSTTCLLLLRYATLDVGIPQTGLAPHTDVGTLTILFSDKKGLQARHPLTHEWRYLDPKEGCAVINVGDSLRFLSEKGFQSALHRVVPSADATIDNRFSCAYFLRPELDAEFDAEGQHWKSIDWHLRKYKSYRSGQTGKTE
ncbi:putative gibberellin 2-beta-dioxygenase 7, partial [Truncatella angustata]